MKGRKIRFGIAAMILVIAFCLQGCTLMDPETSYKVTLDDSKKKLEMELKADLSQGYEWIFYPGEGVLIEASTPTYRNDIFSDTYVTKCTFTAHEQESDDLYLILIKDGDIDSAKAYIYPVSFDADGICTLGKVEEKSVGLNKDLKSRVEGMMK